MASLIGFPKDAPPHERGRVKNVDFLEGLTVQTTQNGGGNIFMVEKMRVEMWGYR